MIRRLALTAVVLLVSLALLATNASPRAAATGKPAPSFQTAGRYVGDDVFFLLVTETRFQTDGPAEERTFDCIADVALTIADLAGETEMGSGVCEHGHARVRFEIVGRPTHDGIDAVIHLDYTGIETVLPLATEQVEPGLRADFSGRRDRIDDRVIAFNGTFAAHKR